MSSAATSRPRAVRSPTAWATSFVAHLSMPIAPAPSAEPTTGTPASAHSAARAPSSPSAPCTAGNTTSLAASSGRACCNDAAGLTPGGIPSARHTPSRSIVTVVTVCPPNRSAAATAAAEASDTSCSGFRPPPTTRTFIVMPRSSSPAGRCP